MPWPKKISTQNRFPNLQNPVFLGHDLAAKKRKENVCTMKIEMRCTEREIALSTPAEKKKISARHATYSAQIDLKPRPQVPDGLPVSTYLEIWLKVLVRTGNNLSVSVALSHEHTAQDIHHK